MRLVICDGNRILSEALAAALETYDRAVTAVATSTAGDCIAAVSRSKPDICVLDPRLPEAGDGMQLIGEIRDRWPDMAVLLLSDVSDAAIWSQARDLGIAGFIGKTRSVSQVSDALHKIVSGQSVFDQVPNGSPRPAAPFLLTPRETEVLRRIVAGQHTRQMACEMEIATSTLRSYVKNVLSKLGVHSRLEAAAVASRADLLGLGEVPDRQSSPPGQQKILRLELAASRGA